MNNPDIVIYVACLASYNQGILHGIHITINGLTENDITDQINEMINNSPAFMPEEYQIHDYEGTDLLLDRWSWSDIFLLAEVIEETDLAVLTAVIDRLGEHYLTQALEMINDGNIVVYESKDDMIDQWLESFDNIPEQLEYYIDRDAVYRTFYTEGCIAELSDGRIVEILH